MGIATYIAAASRSCVARLIAIYNLSTRHMCRRRVTFDETEADEAGKVQAQKSGAAPLLFWLQRLLERNVYQHTNGLER